MRSRVLAVLALVAISLAGVAAMRWPHAYKASIASMQVNDCKCSYPGMILGTGEIPALEGKARNGDTQAATILGNHYFETRQFRLSRQWYGIVADRGDCAMLDRLAAQDPEEAPVAPSELRSWRVKFRGHHCRQQDIRNEIGVELHPSNDSK